MHLFGVSHYVLIFIIDSKTKPCGIEMEKLQLLPVLNITITHIYLKCNMMLVILKCNMMFVIINVYISNSLISLAVYKA